MLVVAGGQSSPLFELAEASFDAVALGVADRVKADGAAAGGALPAPVGFLVVGFGDGVGDAASAQQRAVQPGDTEQRWPGHDPRGHAHAER